MFEVYNEPAENDARWERGTAERTALKRQFHQHTSIGTPMGDVDFLYMLGDSVASSVQYGGKATLCDYLRRQYAELAHPPSPTHRRHECCDAVRAGAARRRIRH